MLSSDITLDTISGYSLHMHFKMNRYLIHLWFHRCLALRDASETRRKGTDRPARRLNWLLRHCWCCWRRLVWTWYEIAWSYFEVNIGRRGKNLIRQWTSEKKKVLTVCWFLEVGQSFGSTHARILFMDLGDATTGVPFAVFSQISNEAR